MINESEHFTVTNNDGSKSYTFTDNGSFNFEIQDDVGNTATITASVDWIDKNNITNDVQFSTMIMTNSDVTVTFNTRGGTLSLLNNNGLTTYTFADNGTFTFIAQDRMGNIINFPVTVDWIDKVAPTATVTYSTDPVTGNIIATLTDANEAFTVLNNGGSTSYTFTDNGQFTFQIADTVGNQSSITAFVDWMTNTGIIENTNNSSNSGQMENTTQTNSNQNNTSPATGEQPSYLWILILSSFGTFLISISGIILSMYKKIKHKN